VALSSHMTVYRTRTHHEVESNKLITIRYTP
ncbi:hypothetical protein FHS36_006712, partial [Streptomyces eurocidicus]|nr:hypothetical protein [Streptomyces eurocidicus]